MSCIIKQRTPKSPGVIVFTHAEVLHGITRSSHKVKNYLMENTRNKQWLYGVHVQADCSSLKEWPMEEWQKFIMWPDINAKFLSNVPKEKLLDMACINFMPNINFTDKPVRKWDLCVISRPSTIKRIKETVQIVKKVIEARPETKVLFIVPDYRNISEGLKTYKINNIDKSYYDMPMKIFSSKELENISFISSSISSFGLFPVSSELTNDLISQSKFLLMLSHREGTPRALVEALMSGTPCIVSKSLKTGIINILHKKNSLFIDDDINLASDSIIDALNNYHRFEVKKEEMDKFKDENNSKKFKDYVSNIISSLGCDVDGEWYLDNLPFRLAGHGKKHNFQFMDDSERFFHWVNKSENSNPYDEDIVWLKEIKHNYAKETKNYFLKKMNKTKNFLKKIAKKIIARLKVRKLKNKLFLNISKAKMVFNPHKEFIFKQIERNLSHRNLDNAIIHSHRMLEQIGKIVRNRKINILSVGSCNMLEIYAFKSYGYDNVIGIDLVKPEWGGKFIRTMDMHNMKFADNSFDLIFCSGTFQCSYDPQKLVREFVRVAKDKALICITVPVGFEPTEVYKIDVKSLEGLRDFFFPHIKEILWSETVPPNTEFNPNQNTVIRSIFTIDKSYEKTK